MLRPLIAQVEALIHTEWRMLARFRFNFLLVLVLIPFFPGCLSFHDGIFPSQETVFSGPLGNLDPGLDYQSNFRTYYDGYPHAYVQFDALPATIPDDAVGVVYRSPSEYPQIPRTNATTSTSFALTISRDCLISTSCLTDGSGDNYDWDAGEDAGNIYYYSMFIKVSNGDYSNPAFARPWPQISSVSPTTINGIQEIIIANPLIGHGFITPPTVDYSNPPNIYFSSTNTIYPAVPDVGPPDPSAPVHPLCSTPFCTYWDESATSGLHYYYTIYFGDGTTYGDPAYTEQTAP